MFEKLKNLEIVFSGKGISKKCFAVNDSECHIFIFRLTGSSLYRFDDKDMTINAGEMIFIPKGSSYVASALTDEDRHYVNIGFNADLNDPEPALYSMDNFPEAKYIEKHFYDLWNFGNYAEKYKCLSLFYSLASYLSNIETAKHTNNKYHIIEPAIKYMHAHLYDSNLKSKQLHTICGISNTYFRYIFEAIFSTTPQKYIISKRISHAKFIIDSGDYDTISEVAAAVGYSDALYFSKAFKKKYGVSPSDINRKF